MTDFEARAARRKAYAWVAKAIRIFGPAEVAGLNHREAIEVQRIHDAMEAAGSIADGPDVDDVGPGRVNTTQGGREHG